MSKFNRQRLYIYASDLSIITAIILMLVTAWVWLFWEIKFKGIFYIFFVFSRLIVIILNDNKATKPPKLPLVAWTLFFLWWGVYKISSFSNIIMNFFMYSPMILVCLMNEKEKKKLLEWTFNCVATIIGISLLYYIVFLTGFDLPHKILNSNTRPEPYICYYLFIYPINQAFRFCSIFTEPGHLGMICALFLYMGKYNLKKKRNIIFLIALLMSFSFGGYVLLLTGWLIYIFCSRKSIKPFLTLLLILVGVGFYVEKSTEINGTGIVSTLILDRAKYDEHKGVQGNNRTTAAFDKYYESLSLAQFYSGVGFSNDVKFENLMKNGGNNSIKVTIMQYGCIGLILLLFFFFSIILSRPSLLGLGMFGLFLISYLQRIYWLWPIESFMFICSAYMFWYENFTSSKKPDVLPGISST